MRDRDRSLLPLPGALVVSLAVLALVSPAVPGAAQTSAGDTQRAPEFRERVDVELVEVDVWVIDRDGRPVHGLAPESFTISHDGQPVPIAQFAEVRGGVVAAESAGGEAEPVEVPSHVVVYVDHSRLHPTHIKPLTQALEDLVTAGEVEPERVLVLRQRRGLSVEIPFGSSAEELRQGLARIAASGGVEGVDLENEIRQVIAEVDSIWEESQDLQAAGASGLTLVPQGVNPSGGSGLGGDSPRNLVGGVGQGGGPDACGSYVNRVRPTLDAWVRSRGYRLDLTLSNLSDGIGFLAGLPGVKMLLYLSDGLDTQPGSALFSYAASLCPSAGADLLSGSWDENAGQRIEALTRHANANRVTIHALQASGLVSPGAAGSASSRGVRGGGSQRSSGSFEATRRAGDRDGLVLLAGKTGGRTVFNRNDLDSELAKIAEAARSYYAIAYEPPPGKGPNHQIGVELADNSLEAFYRQGYLEKEPGQQLSERVEGALNLGISRNPLAARLGAGTVEPVAEDGQDGKMRVPVHVIVPAERLTFLPRDGGEWVAEVTVKVMARSVASDVLALREQSFRLKGAPGAAGPVALPVVLELSGGAHLTAVGVRDEGSGEMSFISTMLDAGSS